MYADREENALVDAARAGDRAAMEALLEKYRREVFFLCLKMVGQEEDAEELAQQTFLNAFRAVGRFRGGAAFRTWLYQIAINLCRSHRTRRRPVAELREDAPADDAAHASPLEKTLRDERAREAAAGLKLLPDKQKAAVILRIFNELEYEEIGEIIGCSAGTAKVNFHYGIENLRKRMAAK